MTDSQDSPLVSVIMNAHNSEEFLAEALASVVAQSYTNWEVILWDNASTDGSRSVAGSFGDSRIRYFADENKVSLYASRLNAIDHARGVLIAFLDCDDIWHPTKLRRQVPTFEDASVAASCSDYLVFSDSDGPIVVSQTRVARTYRSDRVSLAQVVSEYRVGMLTLMVRRASCVDYLPRVAPTFSIVEDLDIVARVLQGGDLAPLHIPLAKYRRHPSNFSRDTALLIDERTRWLEDFLAWCPPAINSVKVARSFRSETLQAGAREALLQGRRGDCRRSTGQMLFGVHRFKYLLGSLLPLPWIRPWL